ncbi:MAG: site-specific DNA-methyltransferase [Bacteroidetes bacterium]|nr:site-specific DNA-methyltransferase [Bacteroidota bacterium]
MSEIIFKGKEFVYNHHLAVPFRSLKIHPEKGIGKPHLDGNLIIHGDNLHALKALLPYYAGKIDCIYIDPPYNTGREGWCYNDNVNSPMVQQWLNQHPVGVEDGLRHEKWCSIMWPRLRLLNELLSDTGAIFVSIDDNEQHRLRAMMDEIFGVSQFVSNIIWQKKYSPSNDAKGFSDDHDFIVCYARPEWTRRLLPRSLKQNRHYTNDDHDGRGPWQSGDLSVKTYSEAYDYEIENPETGEKHRPPRGSCWRTSKEIMKTWIQEKRIYFPAGGNSIPRLKRYLSDVQQGIVPRTVWPYTEVGHTDGARKLLKEIFHDQEVLFDNPKSLGLVERILSIGADENALILDSFAGSATTAHATLSLNQQDGGNRRFILVECEDYADTITAERVRRVIRGYDYVGTKKTELLRDNITWTKFKNSNKLTDQVEAIEHQHGHQFERINKKIDTGELVVTGEIKVNHQIEGLGGAFTFCTMNEPINIDQMLTGENLPSFQELGELLFHMTTNEVLNIHETREQDFYLGMNRKRHVWLLYKPDLNWLKSHDAALTLTRAREFASHDLSKHHIVFSPARFVSQKTLQEQNLLVEFIPIPLSLYRIAQD